MTKQARAFIKDLQDHGFSDRQIRNAMEDGEYLKSTNLDQETVEEIHTCLTRNIQVASQRSNHHANN